MTERSYTQWHLFQTQWDQRVDTGRLASVQQSTGVRSRHNTRKHRSLHVNLLYMSHALHTSHSRCRATHPMNHIM